MLDRRLPSLLFRTAVLGLVGALAFSYRRELGDALIELTKLNAIVLLIIPLFLFWNWIASFAWLGLHARLTTGAQPSVWNLSLIRLQAQAVNLLLPLASLGGEILRASILSKRTGQAVETTSAVVLDKVADGAAGVLFALLGSLLAFTWGIDSSPATMLALGGVVLVAIALVPTVLRRLGPYLGRRHSRIALSLEPILETPGVLSTGFYRALAWHMLERLLTAGEIYLAMRAAGIGVGVIDAVFVTAVMTAYSLVFFFVPGQVGAIEAGIVAAFASLGLPASAALTIALVRRARQAFILAIAVLSLWGRADAHATVSQQPGPETKS